MFQPKYTITNQLLENIKKINLLVQALNYRRFPAVVLASFEWAAQAVSTYASTSIEGNPLPLTEVKKVLKSTPTHIRDSEREVLNYNQALKELDQKLHQSVNFAVSTQLILHIHTQVTQGLLPPHEVGKFRRYPVVVNDPRSRKIAFLPPNAEEVSQLMTELVDFTVENKNMIDPLILAGIFHKQMVIIHPFMDGNGRTTRLATRVLLAQMGLNTFNLFSFENYYNQNVSRYFQTVGEYGDYYDLAAQLDFTAWLEYFTGGIIDELLRVEKLLPTLGVDPRQGLKVHDVQIVKYVTKNGFITDKLYAELSDRAKATRTQDFKRLLDLGLISRKGQGRATYYVVGGEE